MKRPGRWTFVAVLCLTFHDKTLCQTKFNAINDCAKIPGLPSSTDIYNSLLTAAAGNAVLPDIISKLQGQPIVESLSKCPYSQDILTKPLSVVPMPSCNNGPDPIILSNQPLRQPNQNILLSACPSVPVQSISPSLTSSNCISQVAQPLLLENYSQNVGVQPKPIVFQPQNQCNDVNAYFYNQIADPILSDIVPYNFQTLPPVALSPINTCSGGLDIAANLGLPCLSPLTVLTNDCPQMPLQISLPPTCLPVPKVTVVSPSPSSCPYCPDYALPPCPYPQPPVVLGSSKSGWKKWLPILLVALLSERNDDGGRRCCCCSRNGGGNNIPIPFPIPIPINNPVINSGSFRNRETDDLGEDDEYDREGD